MKNAYLDIETAWDQSITVIGIYRRGLGTVQLIAPEITAEAFAAALHGVETIFTFNGARFDLPVIAAVLGEESIAPYRHRDLMHDCSRKKIKGGLKAIERRFGIHRDTEGVDGVQAMRLWAHHQSGHKRCVADIDDPFSSERCCEALDLLLRYNKEDCVNLEALAQKLGILPPDVEPPHDVKQLSFADLLGEEPRKPAESPSAQPLS
jgi:uncharacterized protein YprB with RNaseH-like and TPR domain